MRRLIFTILVSTLFWTVTNAQVHYPVRTYTTVTAPAPYGLDGFISTPGKLNLQIVVDDISLQEHPVKLRLFIKGSGINIYTRPNYTPQPVYLDGGLTEWLTGEDLRELFNPQHLIFEGYSKNQYQRSGRLPEGVYRVGFEVVDYHRNVVISQSIPAIVMMYLSQAPRLIAPRNTEEIDPAMTPSLRFSWLTPGISNPLADVNYRFRLWQIRPNDRAAEEVVRISRPHFQTETSQNWLLYDATLPPLESGMDYVWEVEAVDQEGLVIFKNEGKSDISSFSYGQKCPVPSPYLTQVSTSSASVRWNYNPAVQFYRIFLRKTGNEFGWEEIEASSANHTIKDLDDFSRYEMKVISVCNDCESDESDLLKFRTNRDVNYACGAGGGNFDLSNTNPLLQLKRFDIFKAADFLIEVESASGENGIYSGTGLMTVPYLNFLKFKVHFDNISINTDYRMISGEVFFVYDEATGMVLSEDDFTPDSEQNPGYQEVNVEDALKDGTDHQVNIDGEVADITVEGNTVTITTTDGETQTITASDNQTVGVSPLGGTQAYVADTSSGRVYSFPKKSSGSPNEVRSSVQSGVYGGKVSFSPSADQRYGLDVPGAGRGKPEDYFDRDKSGNLVSWKSLEAGMLDYVDISVEGDLEPDSLRYIRSSGFPVPSTPMSGRKNGRSLLLTGGMSGDREMLSVARVTQKSDSDSSQMLTEVGAINLATYGRQDRFVKLIRVHDARFPEADAVQAELNRIYSPAVVEWQVFKGETISKNELGDLDFEDFQTGNTGMLDRYTDVMKKVYKYYKRTHGTDKKTQYLFFIDYPDADKKGFMPLTGQYGFIFNFGMDFEIMAHELAHGAFNLRHPFSPESSLKLGEGTSDNLMDYGSPQGIGLWKYQWDLMHDPENVLFAWTQEEEEGAYIDPAYLTMESFFTGNNPDESQNAYTCLTPAGIPITIHDNVTSLNFASRFTENIADGALTGFKTKQGNFVALYNFDKKKFLGYARITNPRAAKPIDRVKDSDGNIAFYEEELTASNNIPATLVYLGYRKNCAIEFKTISLSEAGNKPAGSHKGDGDLKPLHSLQFTAAKYLKTITDDDACILPPLNLTELNLRENAKQSVFNLYGQGGLLMMLSIGSNTEYIYTNTDQELHNYFYRWDEAKNMWMDWSPQTQPQLEAMDIILAVFDIWGEMLRDPHFTLDALGTVPVIGAPFDLVNGFLYVIEGEYFYASLSFLATIPFVFEGVTYVKYICKTGGMVKAIDLTVEGAVAVSNIGKKFKAAKIAKLDDELFEVAKLLDRNKDHISTISKLTDGIPTGNQLNAVLKKVNGLSEAKQAEFFADIAKVDGRVSDASNLLKNNISKIDEGVVEAWALLDGLPVIRLDVKNLENLKTVIKHPDYTFTTDQLAELSTAVKNSNSKARLIEELSYATKYPDAFGNVDEIVSLSKRFTTSIRTLDYISTSGTKLISKADKTVTMLGRWTDDMQYVKSKLLPSDFNVGTQYGDVAINNKGFNFLNISDDLVKAATDFFTQYNKPWLDKAIERGDDIILVTRPTNKADYITKDKALKGNYAKELEYLVRKNYKPKNITDIEWNTIKTWFE